MSPPNEDAPRSSANAPEPRGVLQSEVEAIATSDPESAIRLADLLIRRAIERRASDIHIHPLVGETRVRMRIDGRLVASAVVAAALGAALVARLKVMAKVVVFQRRLPQDGRIAWPPPAAAETGGHPGGDAANVPATLRVSFLPTLHGEDVVVRLPQSAAAALELDSLGMEEAMRESVRRLLDLEQGTLLLTGPGGSGKTTTLYAFLRTIHRRRGQAAHILTLEDPIEQDLEFAGQTPIRTDQGLDWTAGLRSVLRHDPNVILIGEIRDRETAEIAVQAGLTGHLVLSTIHSGRATGVLVRLLHMGIEPYLVASSVTCVLAQRLVARLCPECRRPAEPPPWLARALGVPPTERLWTAAETRTAAAPCPACEGIGARGRLGVFERLIPSAPVREAVLERAPEDEVRRRAFPEGDALLADALAKARAGILDARDLERLAATAS